MRSGRISRAVLTAAVTVSVLMVRATVAMAGSYPGGGNRPPSVKGQKFFRENENPANTGLNILLLLLLALLALLIGLLFREWSRRRAAGNVE